jgi:hypothetical protein
LCNTTWLKGLIEASETVTFAFSAALTLGRITPLKTAELVPTKYTTTNKTIITLNTQMIARSQRRRFLGAGGVAVVVVASAISFYPLDSERQGRFRLAGCSSSRYRLNIIQVSAGG